MLVLTGFMGAGKTTIGSMLAERLGLPFVDVDRLIEQRTGMSIRQIFAEQGERAFRALEHETTVETIRGPDAVVALGGGAVEHPATREALRDVTVIYLEVSFAEAMDRIGHDAFRPMLKAPDVSALFERRLPVYRETSTLRVSTDGRRPDEVVHDIVSRITTPTGGASTPT